MDHKNISYPPGNNTPRLWKFRTAFENNVKGSVCITACCNDIQWDNGGWASGCSTFNQLPAIARGVRWNLPSMKDIRMAIPALAWTWPNSGCSRWTMSL